MSGIDSYNLKNGKIYKFVVFHNIIKDIYDKQPHYYEAIYYGRTGLNNSIWVFSDFTDKITNEKWSKINIKFLGLFNPVFELICGKT
jgi:hypothetical protein